MALKRREIWGQAPVGKKVQGEVSAKYGEIKKEHSLTEQSAQWLASPSKML